MKVFEGTDSDGQRLRLYIGYGDPEVELPTPPEI
jgi:hypothetical protein